MAAWKAIPSWFKLENYDDCANFNLFEWVSELRNRWILEISLPSTGYDPEGLYKPHKDEMFDHIKKYGLFYTSEESDYFEGSTWNTEKTILFFGGHENEYPEKRAAIKNLSQNTAYRFFLDAGNKEAIERDMNFTRSVDPWSDIDLIRERKEIKAKYSHPIATVGDDEHESYDDNSNAFLDIDLNASNEQLLMEFKDWLHETKGDTKDIVKRQFSKADFEDWHTSRVLPYWDLTTIAASENATIPFHILGEALFPGEIGVDNAERVRKVTKRKSQFLFSCSWQDALQVQVAAEKIKRNKS